MEVTERIRLNGKPIAKETFATYFFQVWDRLQATLATPVPADGFAINNVNVAAEVMNMPSYFQLLTLVRVRTEGGTTLCFDYKSCITQNVVLVSPVDKAKSVLMERRMGVWATLVCMGIA